MSRREVGGLHFDGKEDTAGRRPRRQGMDSGQLNTRPFITPQAIQRSLRQLHRPSVPLVKKMIFHLLQNAHAAPQTDLIRSHFRYSPQALKDLFFHPELTGQLANLVDQKIFPHLLFFGPSGSGKHTRAYSMIGGYCGAKSLAFTKTTSVIMTALDEAQDFEYYSTSTVSIFDLSMYQVNQHKYLKVILGSNIPVDVDPDQLQITQPQPEDSNDDLKVLILENADYMTQATTKLVMQVIDKCSESIRFVMLTNSVCGIEERLKSRVMAFPVPSPPQRQIELFLGKIAKTKLFHRMPAELAARIAIQCEGNLRVAIHLLHVAKRLSGGIHYPFSNAVALPMESWRPGTMKLLSMLHAGNATPDFFHQSMKHLLGLCLRFHVDFMMERITHLVSSMCPVEVAGPILNAAVKRSADAKSRIRQEDKIDDLHAFLMDVVGVYAELPAATSADE